uniref:Uncharacterized protein n=1 Tax=Ananas comosus var. bracteatus TaxID=296719 RepID=A0A6V7PEE5_ANACO|nr:unnamed protein product [Ananas comosus var. bracteatus]
MERYRITPSFNNGSSLSSPRPHFNSNSPFYLSVPPNPPPSSAAPPRHARRRRAEHLRRRALLQRRRRRPRRRREARRGRRRRPGPRKVRPFREPARLLRLLLRRRLREELAHRPYATPTASSEASWNSRSGLLVNPPGAVAVKVRPFPPSSSSSSSNNNTTDPRSKAGAARRRGRFGRRCPCAGWKSVDVEERYSEPRSSPIPSSFDAKRAFGPKKLSAEAGELGPFNRADQVPPPVGEEETTRSEAEVEGITKVKITPGNWGKGDAFFSPKKPPPFSLEMGRRRAFAEPGAFSFPVLARRPPRVRSTTPRATRWRCSAPRRRRPPRWWRR